MHLNHSIFPCHAMKWDQVLLSAGRTRCLYWTNIDVGPRTSFRAHSTCVMICFKHSAQYMFISIIIKTNVLNLSQLLVSWNTGNRSHSRILPTTSLNGFSLPGNNNCSFSPLCENVISSSKLTICWFGKSMNCDEVLLVYFSRKVDSIVFCVLTSIRDVPHCCNTICNIPRYEFCLYFLAIKLR